MHKKKYLFQNFPRLKPWVDNTSRAVLAPGTTIGSVCPPPPPPSAALLLISVQDNHRQYVQSESN